MRWWMATYALAALALSAACEDVGPATPADAAPDGADASVDGGGTPCAPVKVDLLWVVDESTSMCQEQAGLAEGFTGFVERIAAWGDIDLRTAVTTTAVLAMEQPGAFVSDPADEFPPACRTEELFPATSDLQCECAACAGFPESFAYQCGQDAAAGTPPPVAVEDCPGDPAAAAPDYVGCLADGGCAAEPLARLWTFRPPPGGSENNYNRNGSVNATCVFGCGASYSTIEEARIEGTEVCRDYFGDDDLVCQVPDLRATGCVRPPDTADCPDGLPAVLPAPGDEATTGYGLDWFRCLSTVGAHQETAAGLEEGLKAAWLALDADGEVATQVCDPGDPVLADPTLSEAEKRGQCARRFLREDAWLVIAFVSDEDDCSVRTDDARIVAEDYNQCALLGDAETPPVDGVRSNSNTSVRPLETVATFVRIFRQLAPDPERVVVAAFVGDVWDPLRTLDEAAIEAAREAYFESKTERTNPLKLNTYIVAGPNGRADLGLRYIRLTEAFGAHGLLYNIAKDLPGELTAFADDLGALVAPDCE